MWHEFGSSLPDRAFIAVLSWIWAISSAYESVKYSERTQAFINTILLGIGDVSSDVIWTSADTLIESLLEEEEIA